jgi:hypothetical protein
MWMQYTDPFAEGTGGPSFENLGVNTFAKQLEKAVKSAFDLDRLENFFRTLNTKATELNTTLGAGLKGNISGIETLLKDVYLDGVKFGFAYDDAGKYLDKIQGQMGRLVPMSSEHVKNALALGKAIGATPEEMGPLIASMTEYAFSQEKSVKIMNKVAAVAKASGLDAKKLTATVSKELYKTQIYGFKNGVDGLTKMAAQAQRVGLALDKAQVTANLILDGGPEKAIEMASQLQALGGNIGALGDPFQLIHMAQYDMEGLQDQIINASASAVQFNETTGDFKISGEEMLRLREQAKVLGLTYEDVAKGAINMRKEQEIASRITFPSTITEEQKNLVASLAEIGPNGSVKIDLPGFEGGVKDLQTAMNSPDFMDALNKYGEDLKISNDPAQLQTAMYTNAQNQLSVAEQMKNTLIEIQNQGVRAVGDKGFDAIKQMTEITTYASDAKYNQLFESIKNNTTTLGTTLNDAYKNYAVLFKTGVIDPLITTTTGAINTLNAVLNSLKGGTPPAVSDAFIPAGGKSMVKTGFGQILPNTADEMLFSPDISDFFAKYNESEKRLQEIGMPKGGDLSMMYKSANASPNTAITDLMSKMGNISSGPSEIKQTVEIGGKTEVTLNINTNIPQNLISQVLDASQLKETIMNTVNDRLSAAYSDKLTNALITQKRG